MELQGQKINMGCGINGVVICQNKKKKKINVALWILITNPTGGFL